MVQFPSGAAYVEALQNTRLCFAEPDLKGAKVELDKLARPRPISGNFASVFSVTTAAGKRHAIKCFTREVADQTVRYRAISDHLNRVEGRWKVGFEYLQRGVLVEGRWYPVLKMDWVEGTGLTRWIEQHVHDQRALVGLAERFAALVADLADAGIAHGDLQHGNLLVASDGSLRLVDYDGMYVPALDGMKAAEMGHRNYQSPLRSDVDFRPDVDRFSAWVIYLSLVSVAADPALWGQLHQQGGEYLLLAEEDYTDPAGSSRFPILLDHQVPEVRELVARVRGMLGAPVTALPPLTPITFTTAQSSGTFRPVQPAAPLPPWMADHVLPTEPVPRARFVGRDSSLTAVALVAPLLVVGTVLLAVLAPAGVALTGVCGLLLWFASTFAVYRARQETRAKRREYARLDELDARLLDINQRLAVLTEEGDALAKSAAQRAASEKVLKAGLQERHRKETAAIDTEAQRQLASIMSRRGGMGAERKRELDQALADLRAEHVRQRLATVSIADAGLEGLGGKLVANLREAGIATAADFAGVNYVTNSQAQNKNPFFRLPSGLTVRVPGFGAVKASRLEDWRQKQEWIARNSQPTGLPDSLRRIIESRFAQRVRDLDELEQQVKASAMQQKALVNERFTADLVAIADQVRAANAVTAQRRVEHDRAVRRCHGEIEAARTAHLIAARETTAYDSITYPRFLRFAFTGR